MCWQYVLAVCVVQRTSCAECEVVLHGGVHNGRCTNIERMGIYDVGTIAAIQQIPSTTPLYLVAY